MDSLRVRSSLIRRINGPLVDYADFTSVFRWRTETLTLTPALSLTGSRANLGKRLCYTASVTALYADTHPKMEALQIRLWREAPAWRKMEMLAGLNASVKTLALSGLRQRHPQASEGELRRRLADLLLGEELARKVYGELENAA